MLNLATCAKAIVKETHGLLNKTQDYDAALNYALQVKWFGMCSVASTALMVRLSFLAGMPLLFKPGGAAVRRILAGEWSMGKLPLVMMTYPAC